MPHSSAIQTLQTLGLNTHAPALVAHTSSLTTSLPTVTHPLTPPLLAVSGESSCSKTTDTVVVAPGIPALKQSLVDLILADKYVDLGELPPAKGFSKPLSALSSGLGGQVVLQHASSPATSFRSTKG